MTSLYSLRRLSHDEYSITKFDRDYNPEGTYALSKTECSCPQSHRDRCRHRTMLPLFLGLNHVDDGWFLDWDTRQWQAPIQSKTEIIFTCVKCEANYSVLEETNECPVCGWKPASFAYDINPIMHELPGIKADNERALAKLQVNEERFAKAYESESSNAALSTSATAPAIKRRKI